MNINRFKSAMLTLPLGLMLMTACTEGDDFDYDQNQVYVTGTESNPVVSFKVEDTPATYVLTASTSHKVDRDIKVNFAADEAALEKYNKENGTSFALLPAENYTLTATEGVIKAGTSFSEAVSVVINSTEGLRDELVYVIPISITQADGMDVLAPSKTIYLRLARVLDFMSLSMNNTGMYSNYIFEEPEVLNAFTYEVKFYSEYWHSIARLMSFTQADEQNQSMLRFGEGGYPVNSLQWCTPNGVNNIVTNTLFETNRWYMISLTYDGTNFAIYVDGVKDSETPGTVADGIAFQRMEFGMSWTGYPSSQYFRGRIAEVRVWNRPLGTAEIKGNLCGADPQAEGLVAYWKLNEGEGHIFHDATGHGWDMDWSKTQREVNEGQGLVDTPEAAESVAWVTDDKNKCAQ